MTRKIINIILSGFLCLCFDTTSAAYVFNENCKTAYNEIIQLHFNSAKQLLNREKLANKNNDIPYYLDNYIDFLQLFIGEDPNDLKVLEPIRDKRFVKLENGDNKSPYYRYCLADMSIQWAFVKIKFGDYASAAYDINKAYRLLDANNKQFPNFVLNKKGLGLLHALVGSIPDNFKWVTSIIGMEGSVNKGIQEIVSVFNLSISNPDYSFLKAETLFMLSFLQLNLQSGSDRFDILNQMFDKIKNDKIINSPLIIYCRSIVALHTYNARLAEQYLASYKPTADHYPFHYLYYLTGLAKLYRLDPAAANFFVFYLNSFKGKGFKCAALQKLGWAYILRGEPEKYTEQMNRIKKSTPSQADEDKQAMTEANSNRVPNLYLLKARLLFDGGYFENAYDILLNGNAGKQMSSQRDQLEYIYRLGRICHEWPKTNEAISYYLKTIEKGKDLKYYYAANASLQLGSIYEQQKNYRSALYYYELATNMQNDEYVNSINQKAEAGINRIQRLK